MALYDLTVSRLQTRGHIFVAKGDNAECSCGWMRQMGTGETVNSVAVGHLFAVVKDLDNTSTRWLTPVIITGSNIEIDHQGDIEPERKRRRPVPVPTAKEASTGRSIEQILAEPNPYWSEAANDAAEATANTPKEVARQYRRHRKDET